MTVPAKLGVSVRGHARHAVYCVGQATDFHCRLWGGCRRPRRHAGPVAGQEQYSLADLFVTSAGFIRPGKGGIVVEDDVWIGANCVLLDGAILRRGCVIGAGSVVRGEVPAYSIQAGNPLRLLGWRE